MTEQKKTLLEKKLGYYHQNEALLFQFLLHECLLAYQKVKKTPDAAMLLQVMGTSGVAHSKWCPPQGHFPKFHHYCTILETHYQASLSEKLLELLMQAEGIAKQCYGNMQSKQKEALDLTTELRQAIRSLALLLFEKLPDFRDNPAVLFFLLKHQQQLDDLYQEPIVRKTFLDFFPEGSDSACCFLSEKFSKKGFHHLIPFIERHLRRFKAHENRS